MAGSALKPRKQVVVPLFADDRYQRESAPMERNAASRRGTRLLIVTRFPDRFDAFDDAADVVDTCREAMERLDRAPYSAIFCDMGQLGEQESGFRFANALKKRGEAVPVYLMAESVTRVDQMVAKRNGAADLVERNAAALRGTLAAGGLPVPAVATAIVPAALAAAASGEQEAALGAGDPVLFRVKASLRRHLGPAADHVVADTLASLSRRHGGGVPVDAFAHAVSQYIDDARQRERFLADMLR